jgi:hypothetical protein
MTDELNEDLSEVTQSEAEAAENPGVEAATTEKPANGYEKRIATITAQKYKKEQELNNERKERERIQKELEALKVPTVEAPELPSDDLRYDDPEKYKQDLAKYHQAIALKAVEDREAALASQRTQEQQRQQAEELSAKQAEIVSKYIDNGIKQGISEVKLAANEAVIAEHSLPPELAEFIYSDEHGAKIVDYLADNPDKIQELTSGHMGAAYIKLANEIKPQALSTKPTHTQAPEPFEPTKGSGPVPTEGEPLILKGATFN